MTDKDSCPLISVLVPVYNTEKYLAQCVNSILSQTYPNIELILVDDCSPDNSPAMCDEFARKDSRVRVIHHSVNMKLGAARNTGLDAARGELITIVDSDDYVAPEMCGRLYSLMCEYDSDMVMCDCVRFSGDVAPEVPCDDVGVECITGDEAIKRLIAPGGNMRVTLWGRLYRAELFRGVRFSPGKSHEDTARIHILLGESRKVVITNEKLYFYRIQDDSATAKMNRKKVDPIAYVKFLSDQEDAFRDREEYLRHKGMNDLADFSHLRSSAYGVMALMLEKLNYIQYRKEIRKITGYTPLRLIVRLVTSKHSQLRKRGVKLALLWLRSFFRPFTK